MKNIINATIFLLIGIVLTVGFLKIAQPSEVITERGIASTPVFQETTSSEDTRSITDSEGAAERENVDPIRTNRNNAVSPEHITCEIDSYTGAASGSKRVPVNLERGAEATEPSRVVFQGVTATVRYNTGENMLLGNEYDEPPFLFMMMTDDSGALVYDVTYGYYPKEQSGPIDILHFDTIDKQLRLQCWIAE